MPKHRFFDTHSPLEINKPNTGNSNLIGDWTRESKQRRMFIDGIPLSTFSEQYNNFETEEDITSFFKEKILIKIDDSTKKNEIASYLKKTFHQGGFMYPVSGAIAVSIKENNKQIATTGEIDLEIRVVTTKTGFKVQEYSKVKTLNIIPGQSEKFDSLADEMYRIKPEEGFDYVIEAEGTIDIDFSEKTNPPGITVESNAMNFGHYAVKERLDNRNLFQVIIDFFKNLLSLNEIENISPEVERSVLR